MRGAALPSTARLDFQSVETLQLRAAADARHMILPEEAA